jgi:hypothetical protein
LALHHGDKKRVGEGGPYSKFLADLVPPIVDPLVCANGATLGSIIILLTALEALANRIAPFINPRMGTSRAALCIAFNRLCLASIEGLADSVSPPI